MAEKLKAGILGATGMVGQRFVTLLKDHPFFEISVLAASERSAGKTYGEAVTNRWKMEEEIPDGVKEMPLYDVHDVKKVASEADFVFCALNMPKEEVKDLEESYAKEETPVISNNSANRWTKDVPMIIPELNPEHLAVIPAQKQRLHTERGFIVVKPNCSIQSYTPLLYALRDFGLKEVAVSTYQAVSGAGRTLDNWQEMQGNVIPYIEGEEEKSEKEPLRIFGEVRDGQIAAAKEPLITAQCFRVPVTDGHMASVFVRFRKKPEKDEILARWKSFEGLPQKWNLPSAPHPFICYLDEPDRPQVTLDRDFEHGMSVMAGRLREDPVFDYKFAGLSHNTLRGAAGGGVLMAEFLTRVGLIVSK